ncbi:alpha-crystallin domain-containing protein 22.3-like isoform X2 [Cucurbita maxima]|uniref:Alpha-crystallin domain-containing protein 22.3-like isoform X2 n=1 Tax=Cucurbita maxima TaxID=3661 RepID=A0A6J1HN09_CUCMA|nr:alpha-crystallin domain-containing protein 22.3-like isoform X2 [Cucurbita maxima]
MTSPARAEDTRKNEAEPLSLRNQILDVAPINSMPYIGPPLPHSYIPSSPRAEDPEAVVNVGPAMVYCPLTTHQEWDNIVSSTKSGVALTGTAAMGKVGPVIGRVDIGENDNSYFFRVSLPGVARDQNSFSCDMDPDGKVKIIGVTTTGENIVCKNSQVFRMQSKNLCPPGHFSITFQLPGPVNNLQFSGAFGADGILEGSVSKG